MKSLMIDFFPFYLLIVLFCYILYRGKLSHAVEIEKVSPSQSIENSTADVVLDCQYKFDVNIDERLVLKWYHNSDPYPIYQWIPKLEKRDFSNKIQPFVDKSYAASDKLTQFRAIRLIKPTTNLSGQYTCIVSSLHNHASNATELLIYAPAKKFDININPVENGVNISCIAQGLFPIPTLTLWKIANNESKVQITKETKTIIEGESGQYDIMLTSQIIENSTQSQAAVHYECVLSITQVNYTAKRSVAIQPGWHYNLSNASVNNKEQRFCIWQKIILILLTPSIVDILKLIKLNIF